MHAGAANADDELPEGLTLKSVKVMPDGRKHYYVKGPPGRR